MLAVFAASVSDSIVMVHRVAVLRSAMQLFHSFRGLPCLSHLREGGGFKSAVNTGGFHSSQ